MKCNETDWKIFKKNQNCVENVIYSGINDVFVEECVKNTK